MPKYILFTVALCFVFVLASCGKDAETEPAASGSDTAFPVEVTRAVQEQVTHSIEAVGTFLPEEEVVIGAEVAGTIKALSVDEGTVVEKGRLLLEIDDEQSRLGVEETEAMLRESLARLKNAETTLRRMEKLYDDRVIGQNDYDDALTQVALNKAVVEKLRAQLKKQKKSLRDTRVLSPIDGTVSERMVSPGEYVKVGAELLKIVDTTPLKLSFSLPEKNAGQIENGQKVIVTTRAYPGETFEGTVYYVSPTVDDETRTIEVKALFDNADQRLKPGFYVDVILQLGSRSSLVLPESAVIVREGVVLVMAVREGTVRYMPIETGMRFDGRVEIIRGITDKEDIVVSGRSEITEGTAVRIVK